MQETKNYTEGQNVFLDFTIIENSNLTSLSKELDILIASGKKIHIWSKTVSPSNIKSYCDKTIIPTPEKEKELHKKIYLLRHKKRMTFADISKKLGIDVNKVSYYANSDPLREWRLSDWIEGYYNKDSAIYDKVDYLVDSDERLVNKFKRAGRVANLIKEVV